MGLNNEDWINHPRYEQFPCAHWAVFLKDKTDRLSNEIVVGQRTEIIYIDYLHFGS